MRVRSVCVCSVALCLLACLLAGVATASREDAPQVGLPAGFVGTWEGTMRMFGAEGVPGQEVPMRIEIEAAEPGAAQPFRLIYGDPATAPVRDYVLTKVEGAKNHFVNDERNGILLDTYLVGDTLYSQFEIASVRIDSRFRLEGETLISEMATFGVTAVRDTRLDADSTTIVRSYPLRGVQIAKLMRR